MKYVLLFAAVMVLVPGLLGLIAVTLTGLSNIISGCN